MAKRKTTTEINSRHAVAMQPEAVEIASLVLDPANARAHDSANVAAIAASLHKFGQRKAIVVRRSDRVIEAGNGTCVAAKQLGWTHLAVVWVDDDAATAVGYALADNRTAELADWDQDRLLAAIEIVADADPELADALLLDDLRRQPERVGEEITPQANLALLIEHLPNEAAQQRLYSELVAQGLQVRVLTA